MLFLKTTILLLAIYGGYCLCNKCTEKLIQLKDWFLNLKRNYRKVKSTKYFKEIKI